MRSRVATDRLKATTWSLCLACSVKQFDRWGQCKARCAFCQSLIKGRKSRGPPASGDVQCIGKIQALVECIERN